MNFIDVFCGAGGFTEGLKQAGWRHIVGIDNDKFAAETYRANHGDIITKDIKNVSVSEVQKFIGRKKLGAIVASPPCTSFSYAGKRQIGDDRDYLYKHVVRLTKYLQPRWVIIENVVGFLNKSNVAADMMQDFKRIGYKGKWKVLSTMQFGLPQKRERAIFIAAKNIDDVVFPDVPRHITIVPVKPYIARRKNIHVKYFWSKDKKIANNSNGTRSKFIRFLTMSKPCYTIRASYFKARGEHSLIKYKDGQIRMLTEKEVAKIQGFPKTYKFIGSLSQIYKQIGNAVAPPMAAGIAKALLH